jgi:hypothetical protein
MELSRLQFASIDDHKTTQNDRARGPRIDQELIGGARVAEHGDVLRYLFA